jgi:hypothetical protein
MFHALLPDRFAAKEAARRVWGNALQSRLAPSMTFSGAIDNAAGHEF